MNIYENYQQGLGGYFFCIFGTYIAQATQLMYAHDILQKTLFWETILHNRLRNSL